VNIIEKPWGQEEIIELNGRYMMKKLTMRAGHRCSLQYHKMKKETVYVLSGELSVILGRDENSLETRIFKTGEFLTIEPGIIHRMEAVRDSVYLEASTPEMDDVVRLDDDYSRTRT
jgi:mannose-6-phosphate isomerase-like protein (cupin superfamily)